MNKRDYYEVLELQKGCSESQIKKAYKKLALKWHPNLSIEKFKEIGEAYSVLSDKNKREIYDKYGFDGLNNGGNSGEYGFNFKDFQNCGEFSFANAENLFQDFFKDFGFDDNNDGFGEFFSSKDDDNDGFGEFFSSKKNKKEFGKFFSSENDEKYFSNSKKNKKKKKTNFDDDDDDIDNFFK